MPPSQTNGQLARLYGIAGNGPDRQQRFGVCEYALITCCACDVPEQFSLIERLSSSTDGIHVIVEGALRDDTSTQYPEVVVSERVLQSVGEEICERIFTAELCGDRVLVVRRVWTIH